MSLCFPTGEGAGRSSLGIEQRIWLHHARFHVTLGVTNQLRFAIGHRHHCADPVPAAPAVERVILLAFALLSTVALVPAALWHGSGPPAGTWVLVAACIVAMISHVR